MKTKNIFINSSSIADSYIKNYEYPFEVLPNIETIILRISKTLGSDYEVIDENIFIHKTANISKTASVTGPCIIDAFANIKHNAFINGNVIIGKNATLGSSSEIKNTIVYDNVHIAHLNYVGDSIIGFSSHLGAGAIISNLRSDKKEVILKSKDEKIPTHLNKVGAFVGDFVEIGCNSVLNPGTIIHKNTTVYPLTSVRGTIEENSIVKQKELVKKTNEMYNY